MDYHQDEDDEIMDGVGRLSHLRIHVDQSNYAPVEDMAAHFPGQSGVDGNTGLSQGSSTAPFVYMYLVGGSLETYW